MLQFILGVFLGGFVAFIVFGIISINKIEDKKHISQSHSQEAGDQYAED